MYNKLFTKILDSSIWLEPDATRLIWLTFLAVMDEDGFAQFAGVRNVAYRARVTEEAAEKALATLEGPDPESSDPDFDGRRLERVPGGWMVLNAQKYKDLVTRVVQREQTRIRVERHRERRRNASVTKANDSVTQSEAEAETYSESRSETKKEQKPAAVTVTTGNGLVTASRRDITSVTGRSKRPIFSGQKLTVFEWMLDECMKTLGTFTDQFNLHEWFFTLDSHAMQANLVIPKRDNGAWLFSQLRAEIERRQLPITFATAAAEPTNKRIAGLVAGGNAFLNRKDT